MCSGYIDVVEFEGSPARVTRRRLIVAAGAAAAAYGAAATGNLVDRSSGEFVQTQAAPAAPQFHTRPDLRIPGMTVGTRPGAVSPGLLLLAPYNGPNNAQAGAVIFDDAGDPVWEQPLA